MSKACGLGQWVTGSAHVSMSTMSVCACLCDPVSGHAMFKEPFVQVRHSSMGIGVAWPRYLTHYLTQLVKVEGSAEEALAGQDPDLEGQQRP